jgi:hypothetical protein
MKFYIPLLSFLLSFSVFAQVGINTISPHPSSMLDVSSTTQGMLTPRMTTVEKNAVASPATGLLVFDTTLNSFQVYNGTAWVFLADAKFRTNYKLVKSVADLSAELAAGGGTAYLLNTNFLYEINGTVVLDKPINLNGAYIEGVDSTEDKLVNNTTGSLIIGNTGGSIRNITLVGSIPLGTKRPIFNMTGGAADLLLVSNVVMANSSKVGTLTGFGTVFFSVTQYVGNDDGFTITGVNSFFVSNIFWTETNTGIFMKFNGSFQDLQMNGGRIVADAGETGIDVSSNPTIVNDATLAQLSFVGAGTLVRPYSPANTYTGFSFSKDWNVNCSGIPTETDQVSSGNMYYGGGLTSFYAQNVSTANGVPFEIKSATNFVATDLFRFTAADNNNDLIYNGKKRRAVRVSVSLSVRVTGADGEFYAFSIAKNGTIVTETSGLVRIIDGNQIQNVSLNGVISLAPTDRIEVFATRYNSPTAPNTDVLSVYSQNLSIR